MRSLPLDSTQGGLNNLAVTDWYLGHSELALKEARQSLEQRRKALPPGMTAEARQTLLDTVTGNVGIDAGDYGMRVAVGCAHFHVSPCAPDALVRAIVAAVALDPQVARSSQAFGTLPANLAALHDARDAEALLPLLRPRTDDPGGVAEARETWLEDDGNIRRVRGDWAGLLKDTDADAALAAQWPGLRDIPLARWRPVAMAHLGDATGARAAADAFAPDCYPCAISHALVEEILGNRPGADRWFAEAVRQGPSLPFAEAAWAEALLARGDVAGALKQAEIAERKNPRYADASEVWGEALLAKGDPAGASVRFAEAAKLAPRWGRLRLKWGEALAKQGKAAEAKVQFAAAAGMDGRRPPEPGGTGAARGVRAGANRGLPFLFGHSRISSRGPMHAVAASRSPAAPLFPSSSSETRGSRHTAGNDEKICNGEELISASGSTPRPPANG